MSIAEVTKKYETDLEEIIELQQSLNNVVNQFDQIKNDLPKSPFLNNVISFRQLLQAFNTAIKSHWEHVEKYLDLLEVIKEPISNSFTTKDLCYEIFTNDKTIIKLVEREFARLSCIEKDAKLYSHYLIQQLFKDEAEVIRPYGRRERRPTPEEIAKNEPTIFTKLIEIIRLDDLEQFQAILSKSNIDLSQSIEGPHDLNTIIDKDPYFLDVAALYGAIKIFKFLFINKVLIPIEIGKLAVAGGNAEIIHLLEGSKVSFDDTINIAIRHNQNQIVRYLSDVAGKRFDSESFLEAIKNNNTEIFLELLPNQKPEELIVPLAEAAKRGYLLFAKIICSIKGVDYNEVYDSYGV